MLLQALWNKAYFTHGVPLFFEKIPIKNHLAKIPAKQVFKKHFRSNWLISLVFRKIDPNMYGFREEIISSRFFKLKNTPLMHGVLIFDNVHHQIIVKGFANWFVCIFLLIASLVLIISVPTEFSSAPSTEYFVFMALFVLIFVMLLVVVPYAIQSSRFSEVATVAAQAWSLTEPSLLASLADLSAIDQLHTRQRNWGKRDTKK